MFLHKSLVSFSTEMWHSTGICEGELALSMTASVFRTRLLTCKYAIASLLIFVTISEVRDT